MNSVTRNATTGASMMEKIVSATAPAANRRRPP